MQRRGKFLLSGASRRLSATEQLRMSPCIDAIPTYLLCHDAAWLPSIWLSLLQVEALCDCQAGEASFAFPGVNP
jgi:hypothetical protein